MGLINRALDKLRGKGLRVVLYAVITLGTMTIGLNLPEPQKQAIVNGSALVIEALTAEEPAAPDTEGE